MTATDQELDELVDAYTQEARQALGAALVALEHVQAQEPEPNHDWPAQLLEALAIDPEAHSRTARELTAAVARWIRTWEPAPVLRDLLHSTTGLRWTCVMASPGGGGRVLYLTCPAIDHDRVARIDVRTTQIKGHVVTVTLHTPDGT